MTCIVQNSDPYTYFGHRPIRICEGAGLSTGSLGMTVLERATVLELPTLLPRVFSGRPERVAGHRRVAAFRDAQQAVVSSRTGAPSRCRSTATSSASSKRCATPSSRAR